MTTMAERYATAAELLRRLASRPDRPPGDDGDPATLTDALAVAAQAYEQVDQAAKERDLAEQVAAQACEQLEEADQAREVAEQACQEAVLYAAHLWSLLEQAAEAVDAHLAGDDAAASWETLRLAHELRQALDEAPDDLGAALLDELRAARVAVRAASGLAAAVHRGDGTAVGQCLATFQHASRVHQAASHAWRAAGRRLAAGEVDVAAGGEPR